jgi:branched-chain amino acid aminotransferase
MAAAPRSLTWFDGAWHEGNPPILGPMSQAFWLGSTVFDGARAFEGVMPDLDQHCARVNRSAVALGLKPTMPAEAIMDLAREGAKTFGDKPELYIRPSYWAESGSPFSVVTADPESTRFALTLWEAPMRPPHGFSITLSPFRRPTIETMPLNAKAGCLYPNNGRMIAEAHARGFDNALVLDMLGNVAELASANVWLVKDGVAKTSVANGTYLAGVTRRRMLMLFRAAGVPVEEATLTYRDFLDADEIFSTGNYSKVQPIIRIEDRAMQPGPVFAKARALYWEFAHS